MSSRFLVKENIQQMAEEDLKRLLMEEHPKCTEFNYSPFILRCINEYLLEAGYSIGLGFCGDRVIIDELWSEVELPFATPIKIRVISDSDTEFYNEIVILLKNIEIFNALCSELKKIKKLRPKNPLVFHRKSSSKQDIEQILEQVKKVLKCNSCAYTIEFIYLQRTKIIKDNELIEFIHPKEREMLTISCVRCNMCELPSHYSVNPISNKSNQPFACKLSFNYHICFPCNLPTLSFKEATIIAEKTKKKLEDFCSPVFALVDKNERIIDLLLALKQKKGVCIFQDITSKSCLIHQFKPASCKNFPFLLT
ncbi:MAG: YkgJ family cysteine cluster protein, partial [Candidatus Heimdallarchaeaceae archaeon]